MRGLDGRLIVNYTDNVPANASGSSNTPATSSINENTTTYVLLPEQINATPYISTSIYNSSTPQIKPIQFNDPDKYNLFVDSQGVIKVAVGSSFILRLKAKQPPIFNIENGVPTIYEDQTKLTYEWQKDGIQIASDSDPLRPDSSIRVGGTYNEELIFKNVSPKFTGTYVCVVSNDIGSTDSEQVNIEVYNPDIEDFFYKNLVDNPYGKDDLNGWQTPDNEFIVSRLSDGNYKNFSQPWNTELFGYTKDMFYPRPYHLNTFHVRNSNLTQDILQEGYYFTREKFKYRIKDGKSIINASYDVDLTDVQEYIQGSIYGVEGVRGVFGCYIGNAISRFKATTLNALITKRNSKYSLLSGQIRLSLINALLAGAPSISENIKVTIQEFDNETPLLSLVNGTYQPGTTLYDPWTNTVNKLRNINISTALYPNAVIPTDSVGAKILYAIDNNLIYPNTIVPPTLGQCIQFNRSVIDKLNFRTNKIRINVTFEASHDVLNLTSKMQLDNSDECFEYMPWETIQKPLHWPTSGNDYVLDVSGSVISVDKWNITYLNTPKSEPSKYSTMLGSPRAMATGFNLVLIPIESAYQSKLAYYTNNILTPLDQTQVYPILESGLIESSPLGLYFQSISEYDYEIIGVSIEHRYNQPSATTSEWGLGEGNISSRTKLTTYKYNKNNTTLYAQPLNFEEGVQQGIWAQYPLSMDANLSTLNNANDEFVVLYNSSNSSVLDSNIPQLIGIINTGLLQYSGINEIPRTYATSSILKNTYLKNMGYQLNLIAADRGVKTPPTSSNTTYNQYSELLKSSYLTESGSTNINYNIRLRNSNQFSASLGVFNENELAQQHLVYSDAAASNLPTILGNNKSYTTNIKRGNVWGLSRASDIEGSTSFYYGTSIVTTVDGSATFKANVPVEYGQSTIDDYEQAVYNDAVSDANTRADNIIRRRYSLDLGSFTRPVVYKGSVYVISITAEKISSDPFYDRTLSTNVFTYEFKASVRMVLNGSTADIIKLGRVSNINEFTPSAIVIPSKQKIYYFLYNYVDNITNEPI